jgi:hypothetical protein
VGLTPPAFNGTNALENSTANVSEAKIKGFLIREKRFMHPPR